MPKLNFLKINGVELKSNLKFQLFLGITSVLFLFRIFISSQNSIVSELINEILITLTFISLFLYLLDLIHSKPIDPFALVINIGILNAIMFFLLTFSKSIFGLWYDQAETQISNPGILYNLISFVYSFIILVSLAIILLAFRELYYYRQKKNVSTYFNTMVVFFFLASFSGLLKNLPDLSYIKDTFFIISVLLIIINSIRISWIAFIVKKEKISLLILSVIISILFVVNLANGSSSNDHAQVIFEFSPALNQFFKILMTYGAIYFSILFFTTLFHIPTAEAFDRKAQEVNFLQYFSKLITESLDFKDLADTVTEIAIKVCNANAAWIAWKEGEEFKSLANKNIGYYDSENLTKFIFENNLEKTSGFSFIINLKKYTRHPELSEEFFFLAAAPLKAHNEIKGYLFAAKKNDISFDDEDKNAIDTFSDYASVAIENSILLEESIEKERLEKELDVAREIQRKILPAKNPKHDKINISSVFIPAFEVGGDYYDFFEINENKFGFIIADVSGKGISAAFIMAEIKGIFESLSKTIERPKDILIKANEILERTLDRKNFVSAAYGLIDIQKEILYISRAGHCPVVLIRNNIIENLRPSGIGLGLNFGPQFVNSLDEVEIKLEDDDIIVLYTDGITEAKNKNMEDFGDKHFEKILIENSSFSADEISNRVIKEVTLFSQNNSQHDDITLVILKWKQKKLKNVNLGEVPSLDGMELKNG
ncbi:MAG: PP2C family protein-serine/threonine phosphatase [Bacteroidetes bacterium]|nr:PP2C family protein-serine/threonine phosphatase [Bacteroidota bacterium]